MLIIALIFWTLPQSSAFAVISTVTMSARPVVKTSYMNAQMQEFAIHTAQEAILKFTTEQEIASAIKESFEAQYPSV